MPGEKAEYAILVFGHTRPASLQYVLEGLKRQGALRHTQVWLDGDQGFRNLRWPVWACQGLQRRYGDARWVKYGSRCGFIKIFIDAILENAARFEKLIVLQDDCFPAPGAVDMLLEGLRAAEGDPSVFSVYGHHFGMPDEGDEMTAFQCWGWAAPTSLLEPMVRELDEIWRLPEYRAVELFKKGMTPPIRKRMDAVGGRAQSSLLDHRFCFDAAMAFLIARAGLVNRRTPEHIIHNFGMGAGHFTSRKSDAYLRPPVNMTLRSHLIRKFDLGGLPSDHELIAEVRYAARPNLNRAGALHVARLRRRLGTG